MMPKTFVCCLIIIGKIKKLLPEKKSFFRIAEISKKPKSSKRRRRFQLAAGINPFAGGFIPAIIAQTQ